MVSLSVPKFILKNGKWINIQKIKKIEITNKWIKNNSVTYFLKENSVWIEYKNGIEIAKYHEIPTEFNYILIYDEKTKIFNILTSNDLFSGKNLQNMKFIDEGKWDQTIEDPNEDHFQSCRSSKVENEAAFNKWLKLDGGNSYYTRENYSWIEKYENGSIAGIFEEIYSDPNFLILFDYKRSFYVKLTKDTAYWGINDNKMYYLADGKWKEEEIKLEEINSDNIKMQYDNIKQALDTEPSITSTSSMYSRNKLSVSTSINTSEEEKILNDSNDDEKTSNDSFHRVSFKGVSFNEYNDYHNEKMTKFVDENKLDDPNDNTNEQEDPNPKILNDSIDQDKFKQYNHYYKEFKTDFVGKKILDDPMAQQRISSISNKSIDQESFNQYDEICNETSIDLDLDSKILDDSIENETNLSVSNDLIEQASFKQYADWFDELRTECVDYDKFEDPIEEKKILKNIKSISNDSLDQFSSNEKFFLKRPLDIERSIINIENLNKIKKKNRKIDEQVQKLNEKSDVTTDQDNEKLMRWSCMPVNQTNAIENFDQENINQCKQYLKTRSLKKITHIRIGLNFKMI